MRKIGVELPAGERHFSANAAAPETFMKALFLLEQFFDCPAALEILP